jgi:hypothetical protein
LQVFALNFRTSTLRQAGFTPAIPYKSIPPTQPVSQETGHRKGERNNMEHTAFSTWAAAHPQSVRPLNHPLLSLAIRVLEFLRPVREALAILSLAPKRDEIILMIPEGAWSVLEETLLLDAVSPVFEAHLRRDIARALKAVRRINLKEVQDA